MEQALSKGKFLGATLLVSGCCVGAGMLGLPALSKTAGFFPSFVAMVFSYLFTTASGLLLLEASLWFDTKINLLSIAQIVLGRWGKYVAGSMYLFLFYCIFVAYMDATRSLFGAWGMGFTVFCMGAITYVGTKLVDRINRILMVGLLVTYTTLVFFNIPHVQFQRLAYSEFSASFALIPILLICFGYQNLVPSLTHYLGKNVQALRFAIIIGNMIPLILYFLFNFVILGSDASVVQTQAFTFFALMTSFLASSVTFVDFLKDGLKKASTSLACALVFLPPLCVTLSYPNLFLKALSLAGGFADVILFGLLPPLIVYIGRYFKNFTTAYKIAGGKPFLISMFLLSLAILYLRF